MRLSNIVNVVIPEEKITDYLLSVSHRDGRHKAAFFNAFGFTAENWQDLAAALIEHAGAHDVTKEETTPFGKRYVIEGIMGTPDGRNPVLRTVWFVEAGADLARFVTAYPLKRKRDD